MKKQIVLFSLIFTFGIFAWSNSHFSTESHKAQVNDIVMSPFSEGLDPSFFSVGDDGFVIKWTGDGHGEHYQLTELPIKMIACSPTKNYIAVYESDGVSVHKVSVWDWQTLKRKYFKKFRDTISSLQFSAKGTYLIVGTASIDGVKFYDASTGNEVNKITDKTGIVSYINTSSTEKTAAFYSPNNGISYYNLKTGNLKRNVQVEKGLNQPIIFNNTTFLAGIKDDTLYIENTVTGKNVSKTNVENQSPIIISTKSDKDLYYLIYTGGGSYQLRKIESYDNGTVSRSRNIKTIYGPKGSSMISEGTKDSSNLYLGNKNGSIYTIDITSDKAGTLNEITEDTFSKIYGMAPSGNDFVFLTSDSIYKSSYETGNVEKITSTKGETNITPYKDDKVILWTKETRKSVYLMDLSTKTRKFIFTPDGSLQSLKTCTLDGKDYILDVEGNTYVKLIDLNTKRERQIYSGTGAQDAVLANDGHIYVAKAAATNPKTPLIRVDIKTRETAPINTINGEIVFSLSTDGTMIYGIKLVPNDDKTNTYVFSYNTETGRAIDLIKYPNEDFRAFTSLKGNNLYTNIGKDKVYCYDLTKKKPFSYDRSASIPQSVCQNNDKVVILNYDGSISWATQIDGALITDWYLNKNEVWREF